MVVQAMPVRVALLHNDHHYHNKVIQLIDCFASEMIAVKLDLPSCSLTTQLAGCDLILFEAFGQITREHETALRKIRAGSDVPVVMLTTGIGSARKIDGLIAGADAVIPLNTSNEVIVAHCQALLRRWRTVCRPQRSVAL